jgi:hypothetical protein
MKIALLPPAVATLLEGTGGGDSGIRAAGSRSLIGLTMTQDTRAWLYSLMPDSPQHVDDGGRMRLR